ncbi:MAG: hypothetical protein ABI461_00435 [Polyangiaceae bacterium]
MSFATLAPAPDFRYVGLMPVPSTRARAMLRDVLGCAFMGAVAGWTCVPFGDDRAAAMSFGAITSGALHVLYNQSRRAKMARPAPALPMAIVPWGVLIQSELQPRALRWTAIERVDIQAQYVRHSAIDTTAWSFLTVETLRERFVGRARGDVPLDRLVAHLEAYSNESAHRIALDLDGAHPASGHLVASCDTLLHAAREYIGSSAAVRRLSLAGADYRRAGSRFASRHAIEELRRVLSSRRDLAVDPRPFAAILAAEFGARELEREIVALVQSPHPVVAAVAKAAARRLGVATSRTGTLEEVAPFLFEQDVSSLDAWVASHAAP